MSKTVLIVFAHPERESFNGKMLDTAVQALQDRGHEVLLSDLYAMKFSPCLSRHDIAGELYTYGCGVLGLRLRCQILSKNRE